MQAMVAPEYGAPSVLALADVDTPVARADEALVRIHAAAVNPGDWDRLRGTPYVLRLTTGLRRPRNRILGLAIAGRVEAVGDGVSTVRPGDAVLAEIGGGGFAEYARVPEGALAPVPSGLTFEQAAALPVTGVTALQAMRDVGRVRPGQRVLVNGASGGVGTVAVQVAKAYGAEVTGVCGATSVELVRSLGADRVIDYGTEDFTSDRERYDLILDNVGNRALPEIRRALRPGGMLIPNSNRGPGPWLGAYLRRAMQALVLTPFTSHRLRPFAASGRRDDLVALGNLVVSGAVTPVIDRTVPLDRLAEALGHYGTGHARGKVIITMPPGDTGEGRQPR